MSFHQLLCDQAEQRACNAIIRGIAGRDAKLRRTEDPDLHTDWLSWPVGEWVAVCTVKSLDEPDEEVTEFEVRLRNAATSEVVSRRFDRTGGEIRHARHWVLKCVRDPEYRERWKHEEEAGRED
jgi:hypothetical protein